MSNVARRPSGPTDTMKSKKSESFVDKLTGTLGRRKKNNAPTQSDNPDDEETEVKELEEEGRVALDTATIPQAAKDIIIEEGEIQRYLTKESGNDPKIRQLMDILLYWINLELADERIVVRNIVEDLYDGQIFQQLIEKLASIKIEVPEVSQSKEGQKQKLQVVMDTANRILVSQNIHDQKWTADMIHSKDIIAIFHLLIALALHFRAPIRLPDNVVAKIVIATKHQGHIRTETSSEQLTTTQSELGLKGERDAFDTLFDYGPDKLAHVKSSLLAFCNKHLNKINFEVNDLDNQFQDGVFLVLLMGLLEGYFVPLHAFNIQPGTYEEKLRNVGFAFKLMEDAGLPKPRSRIQDIVNGDVKSTLRLLHLLFTKYKHV